MKTKSATPLRAVVPGLRRRLIPAFVASAAVALLALSPARAQTATSAVPGLFNFQGKVANANGTLVGASPNPVNRTVIFRIWDHASASTSANLVYSEQQVVTITDGEFSVLIGQGSAVGGTPLGYSETAKGPSSTTIASASVFGGATRFLGITIDDNNGATTDPEITPRQQLVTSAYAFRAKYAESVGSNGTSVLTVLDSGNVGIGAANPGARLEVAGSIRAGGAGVTNPQLSLLANHATNLAASITYANSVGNFSSDSAAGDTVFRTDNAAKLIFQSGSGTSALVIDSANKVGIGTAAPAAKLEVSSTDALNTAFISNTGGSFGTQPALRVKVAAASGTRNIIQAENFNGTVFNVRDDGRVGIGTGAPTRLLHVSGTGDPEIGLQSTTSGGSLWTLMSTSTAPYAGMFQLIDRTANTARMIINSSGNVGLNTYTPRAKLDVGGFGPGLINNYGFLTSTGATGFFTNTTNSLVSYGVFSDGRIACPEFNAISDQRIKLVHGLSNSASDLAKLMQIEVTDYDYKDQVANGNKPQKKVLGQQVEKVFPQAVNQSTDTVPDIYRMAKVNGGWIELATDLKSGDRVKLITDKETKIHEVAAVESGRFRTATAPEGDKVFVYGREVKDFRTVDYDAIAMLNVSATQQIKREKDAEIAALKQRIAELEGRDRDYTAKFAALEKMIQSTATAMAKPAAARAAAAEQQ